MTETATGSYDPDPNFCRLQHTPMLIFTTNRREAAVSPPTYSSPPILPHQVPTGTGVALPQDQIPHTLPIHPSHCSLIYLSKISRAQEFGIGKEDRLLHYWAMWCNWGEEILSLFLSSPES